MGRITVFTTSFDLNSKQVLKELERRSLPYTEIDLSEYPSKLEDIKAVVDAPSVPHVFFNTRYIGGVEDCLRELKRWDNSTRYRSPIERYEAEIAPGFDPSNAHLSLPDPSEKITHLPAKSRKANLFVETPEGGKLSARDMTEILKELVPSEACKYKGAVFQKSFTGSKLVGEIANRFDISTENALRFAAKLSRDGFIRHVDSTNFPPRSKSSLKNSSTDVYRLQCYAKSSVLNSYLTWPLDEEPSTNCLKVVDNLSRLLSVMELSSLDPMDGKLNGEHAVSLKKFSKFEEAACELQNLSKQSLILLDENELTAFALNLYHVMIRYAYLKFGVPSTEADRQHFMRSIMFDLAGEYHTLQEWVDVLTSKASLEFDGNNIQSSDASVNNTWLSGKGSSHSARNNTHSSDASLSNTGLISGKGSNHSGSAYNDESTSGSETEVGNVKQDKRIYFALFIGPYGGSRWSAPFDCYTAENLDEQLDISARVFCQENRNVLVNRAENKIELLSSVFKTYFRNYGSKETSVLKLLSTFLGGKKRSDLSGMIMSGNKIKITYREPELGIHTVSGPWYHRKSAESKRVSGSLMKGFKVVKAAK